MPENLETATYLRSIARTDEYLQYRQRASILERSQSSVEKERARGRAISMGAFAMAHAETSESGYRTPEGTVYNLIGHLDSFSRAQTALDSQANLPRERVRALKSDIVEFNHSLKDAIDNNPAVGLTAMLRTMTEAYVSMNGAKNAQVFMGQARTALVGMQHEIAGEQIIDATPGYEVDYDREVTVDDDLAGIDLFVRDTVSGESFGIDLKASQQTAEKSRLKSRNPDRIIWSQCRNEDFNDTFRLDPANVAKKTAGMKAYLDRASDAVPQRAYA